MSRFDIVVIGGGAAGMLASATAAKQGAGVLLLEQGSRLGRKLSITGKGRCNLTNNCSVSEALDNIPTGGQFLHSAFNNFTPGNTIELFSSLGLKLKTERGGRVFPDTDKASDVTDALVRYMDSSGVKHQRCRALDITTDNGHVTGVNTSAGHIQCDAVLIATGGMSYPSTGSTGDGYKIAGALGHTITPLRGSLVPLVAEAGCCERMQGLTLRNVRLHVYDGGKKPVFDDFGELLFTHFGISGPLALTASAHMRDFDRKKYHVTIDLKPALDSRKLDLRILRDFGKYKSRNFSNSLSDLLSRMMIPVVVERSGIAPEAKVHSVSREQRLALGRLIKSFRIGVDGTRPVEEAVITSGGIECGEINPKTMESKLVSGLFFAGEIIDADAYTGGFNLQIAWSTAYAAAKGACRA
jgi:hypothetical protein